jgi:uncharacterized membrane protein
MNTLPIVLWTLWNLGLAAIPVGAAYAFVSRVESARETGRRRTIFFAAVLGLVWLAFLPNSCYLMTEWRHFLFGPHFKHVRDTTSPHDLSVLRVAKHAAFFLLYSGFGVVCFVLAIRPIARVLAGMKMRPEWLAVPFFVLVSLGVYLGLIPRLNSWDLVARPLMVADTAYRAVVNLPLLAVILVYAAVLWMVYLILDIWMDGLAVRMGIYPPGYGKSLVPTVPRGNAVLGADDHVGSLERSRRYES